MIKKINKTIIEFISDNLLTFLCLRAFIILIMRFIFVDSNIGRFSVIQFDTVPIPNSTIKFVRSSADVCLDVTRDKK